MSISKLAFKNPLILHNLSILSRKEKLCKHFLHGILTTDLTVKYHFRIRHKPPIGWIKTKVFENNVTYMLQAL